MPKISKLSHMNERNVVVENYGQFLCAILAKHKHWTAPEPQKGMFLLFFCESIFF